MNTQKQMTVKFIQKVSVFYNPLYIVVDAGRSFVCLISEHLQTSYLERIKTTRGYSCELATAEMKEAISHKKSLCMKYTFCCYRRSELISFSG